METDGSISVVCWNLTAAKLLMKSGAGLKQTRLLCWWAVLAPGSVLGSLLLPLCHENPKTAELTPQPSKLCWVLQQPQTGCSSGYCRTTGNCQCPSVLVNDLCGHLYCGFQTLQFTPVLWKGMGSPLVSDTIPAETLSQTRLHPRSFALFQYKLRPTSLIFAMLANISLIRRSNTQQLLTVTLKLGRNFV